MAKMKIFTDIFNGFKDNPLATLCCLLVIGFAWVYNDMTSLITEQRAFIKDMQHSQHLMNEGLKELNLRMSNIESNFKTTPEQLKELILLLHKKDMEL